MLVSGNKECAPTIEVNSDVQAAAERAVETQGASVGYTTQQPRFNPAVSHANCYYEGTPTRVLDTQRIGSPVYTVRPNASHAETPIIQRELWVKESGDQPAFSMQPLPLNISRLDVARGKLNDLLAIAAPTPAQLEELAAAQRGVLSAAGDKLRVLESKPKLTDAEKFERLQLRDEVLKYGVPYLKELQSREALTADEQKLLEGRNGLERRLERYSAELFSSAAIEDPSLAAPAIVAPEGVTAETKDLSKLQTKGSASLEQSHQTLEVRGEAGTFTIGGEFAKSMQQTEADWKAAVASAAPGDELKWESSSTISGVGAAGKLMSVLLAGSQFQGGQVNSFAAFGTWDTRTGQPVKLDSLLSPKQMNELVNAVDAQLLSLSGDDLPGALFATGGRDVLRERINDNFTLRTGPNGQVTIDVAWESGAYTAGPAMAHFQFEAPNTPEFKKAIGLE